MNESDKLTNAELEEILELDRHGTAAPWTLWTSNSHRRITGPSGRDGGVLSGTVHPVDHHPDLTGDNLKVDLLLIVRGRNLLARAARTVADLRRDIAEQAEYTGSRLAQRERETAAAIADRRDAERELAEARVEIARLRLDLEGLRTTQAQRDEEEIALHAENLDLRDQIAFLRDEWSIFSARPCPACVYQEGKFLRYCKPHEETDLYKRALARATTAIAQAIERTATSIARWTVAIHADARPRQREAASAIAARIEAGEWSPGAAVIAELAQSEIESQESA